LRLEPDAPNVPLGGEAAAGSRQAPGAEPVRVSAVVVNYDGGARLAAGVAALRRSTFASLEILVIDNASTDGSVASLRDLPDRSPPVGIVRNRRNLGYAGAVNRSLPRVRGEYLAVLNMDVEVEPGWLEPLVAFLDAHPEAAGVSPVILLEDGKRINAAGQDIHVTGLGFNRGLGRGADTLPERPQRVPGLHGATFLVRAETLRRAGGMDETGFLYHEDVNLSWLLRLMGCELYVIPGARVRHDYYLSMHPEKLFLLERNRWAMLLAYLALPSLVLLSPFLALTELLLWGYCLLRGPRFLRAKARSYRWLVVSRASLRERRRLARRLRRVSDRQVLRRMRWAYNWDQLATLGKERGPARRVFSVELPTTDRRPR